MRKQGKPYLIDRDPCYDLEIYQDQEKYDVYINDEFHDEFNCIEDVISEFMEMYRNLKHKIDALEIKIEDLK